MVVVVRDVISRWFPGLEYPGFDVIEFCGSKKLLLALAGRRDVGNRERMDEVHAVFARGRIVVSQSGADRRQHVVHIVNTAMLIGRH